MFNNDFKVYKDKSSEDVIHIHATINDISAIIINNKSYRVKPSMLLNALRSALNDFSIQVLVFNNRDMMFKLGDNTALIQSPRFSEGLIKRLDILLVRELELKSHSELQAIPQSGTMQAQKPVTILPVSYLDTSTTSSSSTDSRIVMSPIEPMVRKAKRWHTQGSSSTIASLASSTRPSTASLAKNLYSLHTPWHRENSLFARMDNRIQGEISAEKYSQLQGYLENGVVKGNSQKSKKHATGIVRCNEYYNNINGNVSHAFFKIKHGNVRVYGTLKPGLEPNTNIVNFNGIALRAH